MGDFFKRLTECEIGLGLNDSNEFAAELLAAMKIRKKKLSENSVLLSAVYMNPKSIILAVH